MFPLDYGTILDSAVQAILSMLSLAWSCDLKLMESHGKTKVHYQHFFATSSGKEAL